jgi:hypothetical protein
VIRNQSTPTLFALVYSARHREPACRIDISRGRCRILQGTHGHEPDADAANARTIEARRETPVEVLLDELITTRASVLQLMRQLHDEHLDILVPEDDGSLIRLGDDLPGWSRHDLTHVAELVLMPSQGAAQ